MLQKTKTLIAHPLFGGGLIIMVGSGISNVIAYAYHVIFGRIIGPSQYGELMAVLSLIGIFLAIFTSLGTTVMKFVPGRDKNEVSRLYYWINRDIFRSVFGLCILLVLISPLIAKLLMIDLFTSLLIAPIVFFFVLSLVYISFLQGLLKFKQVAMVNNFSILLRLIFGLLLFYLGFRIFGIVTGILISSVLTFLSAKSLIKNLKLPRVNKYPDRIKILKYSLPVFVLSLSLGSLFSTDMILVKYFFNSHDAGIYGSVSVLGKIIFNASSPVVGVMFPLSVSKKNKGERTLSIFLLSIIFSFLFSMAILVVYLLFPESIINLLYGQKFVEGARFLLGFGVFSILYTLIAFFVGYFLSLGYTSISYLVAGGAVLQIVGIYLFHSTISETIWVSIIVSLLLLVTLFLFGIVKYKNIRLNFKRFLEEAKI